jgi:hypothetical protein
MAAALVQRQFLLIDESSAAIDTMVKRLSFANPVVTRTPLAAVPCSVCEPLAPLELL